MQDLTFRTTPIECPVAFGSDGNFQIVTNLKNREALHSIPEHLGTPPECNIAEPGHRVHFIQVKLVIGSPVEPFILTHVDDTKIHITVNGQERVLFTHSTSLLQTMLDFYGQPVPGWIHEMHLIEIQGRVFSVVDSMEQLSPCDGKKKAR